MPNATTTIARPAGPAARRPSLAGPATLALLAACALLPVPGFGALVAGCLWAAAVPEARSRAALGQPLLKLCVVALGAGLDFGAVAHTAAHGWTTAAATIAIAAAGGLLLARVLKVERHTALLVTVGTAICGGSAIAAAAPVLRARSGSVAVALGVVFALNAVALALFPALGAWLDLDPTAYGTWCALAIHDTSSVVGAAAAAGPDALEIATTTKLARALWIVPVCLLLALREPRPGAIAEPAPNRARARRVGVPPFILGFVGAAALFTFAPAALAGDGAAPGALAAGLDAFGDGLARVGRHGLGAALFAVGLALRPRAVLAAGPRPLALGVLLWLVVGLASLAAVA